MTERVDTIIVGGGQGGLSTSYHLKLQDKEHTSEKLEVIVTGHSCHYK